MLLSERVCVVAGVGSGLGREVAVALASQGAAVVMGARTEAYLGEVEAEIAGGGGTARAVVTNWSAPTSANDWCRRRSTSSDGSMPW